MTRSNVRLAPPERGTSTTHAAPSVDPVVPVVEDELTVASAPRGTPPLVPLHSAIMEFEHEYLLRALAFTNGSRSRAASLLGISRKTLWVKLKRGNRAFDDVAVTTPTLVRP